MSYKLLSRMAISESKAQRYDVEDGVRAARSVALHLFDLRRRKNEADQRVEAARDRLASVDVFALRAELEAALAEQADVEEKLSELQGENVLMAG
ncbi:hypothetical protein [Bradyrhizobium diazoefficiens]|uniref:Uncharacterized protein n=1 Tax=Bradyrhizobium diazoefficiens TaxID=1355477 RepID=A0A810C936_9BRAD|nr:hypothetical protein XF9B_52020 [Bradyrhizobium diazoefficiens]BCF01319.1 hypothetical protein XF11B_53390 [Bradyrhizobium diazoefficiens]BCF09865.1 hypothetical protein XF12B_52380 [Bradyrhizobium diazoefficiens]BCF62355.1 hypothetical protein XF18B_53030 [Bradyrhizobium diazoefficiens]